MAKFPDFFNIFAEQSPADIHAPPFEFFEGEWVGPPEASTAERPAEPAPWTTNFPESLDDEAGTFQVESASSPEGGSHFRGRLADPLEDLLPNTQSGREFLNPDALAVYRSWHLWREGWGIYVSERGVATYAELIARKGGFDRNDIAPIAYRQLLRHELTHFAFEVAATQLEDALGTQLYVNYLQNLYYATNPENVAPLEEAVANYMEYRFSRGKIPRALLRPPTYAIAVERVLRENSPPGYRDFGICMGGSLPRVIAAVCGIMAQQKIVTGRWNLTTRSENDQVPVYWIGTEEGATSVGALPKAVGPPSIKRFEKWVRKTGGNCTNEGPGSHKTAYLRGKGGETLPVQYATSAKILLPYESKEMQRALGLTKLQDLYAAVGRMLNPFTLAKL